MQGLISALEAVSRVLARATRLVCTAMLFVMLGLLAAQVVMRYAFGAPPSWTEEVAIILFAWLVLLFASLGVRDGFHVALDWMPAGPSTPLRRNSDRLVLLLALLLGVVLMVSGWAYTADTAGQMTAALQVPIEWLHAAAPVSGALIVVHAVVRLLRPEAEAGDE